MSSSLVPPPRRCTPRPHLTVIRDSADVRLDLDNLWERQAERARIKADRGRALVAAIAVCAGLLACGVVVVEVVALVGR